MPTKRELREAEVAKLNLVRREETRQRYLESPDCFSGWEWLASKSPRTCMSCLFMDGMQFSLDTPFEDVRKCTNEYCRCTMIAVIIGVERPARTLGAEWFAALTVGQKRYIASSDKRGEEW